MNYMNCIEFRRVYKPPAVVTVKLNNNTMETHKIGRLHITDTFVILEENDDKSTIVYSAFSILAIKIIKP